MTTVGLYTPTQMLAAMKENPAPSMYLQDTLVTSTTISDKTNVEIDTFVGTQGASAYVSRDADGDTISKEGYSSAVHVAPYVNDVIPFTVGEVLDTRLPGETVYEGAASSRLATKTAEWLRKLQDRAARTREKQIAEAIQKGTITVSGKGVSYTVSFGLSANNKETLSGGNVWGTTTDIMGQLSTWATRLRNKGYVPTKLLMETTAANLLLKDTTVLALLDNRRVERGGFNVQIINGQAATYLGTLAAPGMSLDLFSYEGVYETSSDTFSKFFDTYRVVMIGSGLEIEQHFCRIDNAFSGSFIGREYPNQWWEPNGKRGYISLETSPLAVLRNPNAIFSALVVS